MKKSAHLTLVKYSKLPSASKESKALFGDLDDPRRRNANIDKSSGFSRYQIKYSLYLGYARKDTTVWKSPSLLQAAKTVSASFLYRDLIRGRVLHLFLTSEMFEFLSQPQLTKKVSDTEFVLSMSKYFIVAQEDEIQMGGFGFNKPVDNHPDASSDYAIWCQMNIVVHIANEKYSRLASFFLSAPVKENSLRFDSENRTLVITAMMSKCQKHLEIEPITMNDPVIQLIKSASLYMKVFPESIREGVPDGVYRAQQDIFSYDTPHFVLNRNEHVTIHREGVTPHYRCGFFRHLTSDYFTTAKGTYVWSKETFVNKSDSKIKTILDNEKKKTLLETN